MKNKVNGKGSSPANIKNERIESKWYLLDNMIDPIKKLEKILKNRLHLYSTIFPLPYTFPPLNLGIYKYYTVLYPLKISII